MELQTIKQRFGIIGNAPGLNRAIDIARQVAPTDLSVLITGESGTGKEVFPQIIHQFSARKHGNYIAVNCGAIPEGTIDSELFGHEKGSFTGATDSRQGYFEVANGGTIFLDEVAELPHSTQVRLLRVLETGEFIRVGSSKVLKTNVRVVAATNVNLYEAIQEGKFREDLFYRLNVLPIRVPALRERREDIPLFAERFVSEFGPTLRKKELAAPRAFAKGGKLWFWGSISAAAIFGAVIYLPILNNVGSFSMAKSPWAQSSPWGVACWAAITGVFAILTMLLSYHLHLKKNGASAESIGVKIGAKSLGKTVLLALIVVVVSYGCVFFADYFFKTDFRLWVLGIKAFDAKVLYTAVFPYLPLFLIYYVAASVATNSFNNNTLGSKNGKRSWINTTVLAVFAAIPPVALLAIQYATFFSTGFLAWDTGNMQIVWLFPVVVFLPVTTILSRKIFRETGNPYLPGIINGILVTLIACSNTLTWL